MQQPNIREILPLVIKLRDEDPERLVATYQNLFSTPEGQMVLVDLMDQFFEFQPTRNDLESGSHAVVIYIKNKLLGIIDNPVKPSTEEQSNAVPEN